MKNSENASFSEIRKAIKDGELSTEEMEKLVETEEINLESWIVSRVYVNNVPSEFVIRNVGNTFVLKLGIAHPLAFVINEFWDDEAMHGYISCLINIVFISSNALADGQFMEEFAKAYSSLCERTGIKSPDMSKEDEEEVLKSEGVKDYSRKNASRIYAEGMGHLQSMKQIVKENQNSSASPDKA